MGMENGNLSTISMVHAIEALPWGAYKEIHTKTGILRRKVMTPVPRTFWDFWKSSKELMQAQGYTMKKHEGNWFAIRYAELIKPEAMARLLEESNAKDCDAKLLVPPGLAYRPFQRAGIKYCIDRLRGQNGMQERDAVLIGDSPGLGKLSEIDTPTLTPSGWRRIGDLRVGDQVIDADGMASTVTGVFPQGIKPIYEVEFSDGVKTNCGLEHLWEVRDGNMATRKKGWKVMTLGEMMKRGLTYTDGSSKFEIPQFPGHLATTGAQPRIDGWLLGQLIGNGSTGGSNGSIAIASNAIDEDVIARLEKHGGIEKGTSSSGCVQRRFPIQSAGNLMDELRKLDVACKSKEKSLHPSLLVAPWSYRVDLLQGLMDADGSCIKNRITYHTCAPRLAQDVAQLVRSLGGIAIVREYDRSAEGKPTEWQVNVRTRFCPFWSARKAAGWKADPRNRGNKIVEAKYLRDAEAVCIMVDHPRHLYVTEGYKLTHNTIQFLGIVNQDENLRDLNVLIVCPASLKLNWRNEAQKWILDGLGYSTSVVKNKWPGGIGTNFVIVNYESLKKYAKELRKIKWDYACYDEAHYMKNDMAQRTVYALGGFDKSADMLVSEIPAKKTVFLTGTPMENGRPREMFTIIKKCDPRGIGESRSKFTDRYVRSNEFLEELQTQMRMRFMIRRMKEEVLTELPPKVRQVIPIEPEDSKEITIFKEEMRLFKEYQECLSAWAVKTELAKAEGVEEYRAVLKEKKLKIGMTAGELARLRKKTAIAKAPTVVKQVKEVLEEQECLILFAHHLEVLDALEAGLLAKGISVVKVDGRTKMEDRQKAVEDFQAGKYQVFLGGLKPCGVGLTLTKACCVAFCELDWLPGAMTQAEDRANRIGQLNMVLVLHMVMEGSLDEYMAKRLIEKQELIERTLDSQSEPVEDDEEDDDDDTDKTAGLFAPEKAASKGTTALQLQEEAAKMPPAMQEAAWKAIKIICDEFDKKLNGTDRQIAMSVASAQVTPSRAALARKIAIKYKHLLEPEMVEILAWPARPKAKRQQTDVH